MNREIKFRGKAKCGIEELEEQGFEHENGWIYGTYLDGYIVNGVVESTDEYIAIENWCPVKIKTVGQYTMQIARKTNTLKRLCSLMVVLRLKVQTAVSLQKLQGKAHLCLCLLEKRLIWLSAKSSATYTIILIC